VDDSPFEVSSAPSMISTMPTSPHPLLRTIGHTIRAHRLDRGLSQESLADRANIDRSYMSGIERGLRNLSILNIARIASRRRWTSRSGTSSVKSRCAASTRRRNHWRPCGPVAGSRRRPRRRGSRVGICRSASPPARGGAATPRRCRGSPTSTGRRSGSRARRHRGAALRAASRSSAAPRCPWGCPRRRAPRCGAS